VLYVVFFFFVINVLNLAKLGNEVLNLNDFNYNEIKNDCKIHYNKNTKKFILLVPEEIQIEEPIEDKKNYISIDPGLRTFLNCKTNNSYIEIGSNIRDKLKEEFEKLDKFQTIKNNKKKKRYVNILKERMKNQIVDTHWKIINYLTKTYKTILIGKWSTKSIISKKDSILKKMDKRIVQKLSFYQFLDKLKYKCLVKNVNLKIVEEHYTSKVCTNCGNYNKDLTGEKIYECKECKKEIKRDYNGARNIFIKSIKSIEI
jgi:putative transposase